MFLPNLPLILNMSEQGREEEKWLLIILVIGGAILLFIAAIIGLIYFSFMGRTIATDVSYPDKPIDSGSGTSSSEITPTSSKECKISGCSDELCVDANSDEVNSICIYKDEYACYKKDFAKCEVQEDGNCGWTQSDEMKSCLGVN